MRLFSTEKLRAVLKRSKWSKVFLGLALLQLVAALAFLIPALVNVRTMYYFGYNVSYGDSINEYIAESHMKSFKISGECIMFIGFEVWKLWLAFDGVLHSNSRTIWALASFTVFSFGFSIMMIIESVKWVEADEILEFYKILPEWLEELKLVNRNLLIALSCISFCIIPATFYSAFNVGKDFRWDAYKKIGGNIKIQEMYLTVQWLSLALKIDIYFEFCAYALYLFYHVASSYEYDSSYYIIFFIVLTMLITTVPSLILSRYAVSRESKILMVLFILLQLLCIASIVSVMVMLKDRLAYWYAFTGFFSASLIAATGTTVLAIMCLLNFNKGLKEYVQWKPFSKKIPRRQSAIYSNTNQANTFHRLEDQRADEPIDDE